MGQLISSPTHSPAGSYACVKPGTQSLDRKAVSGTDKLHYKAVRASTEGKARCLGSREDGGLGGTREGFTEEVILNKSGTYHGKKQLKFIPLKERSVCKDQGVSGRRVWNPV